MILVYPPVAKACEPPLGIAKLAGFLQAHGVSCDLLDANLEGTLYVLGRPVISGDTWTRRAARNVVRNIEAVRTESLYANMDRYRRAVKDLNRVIAVYGKGRGATLSLSDYQHATLSPLRSDDLLWCAEHPEADPYYEFFSVRLNQRVAAGSHGVVGFSVNYLSQALPAFSMMGFLRKEFPRITLVLGGGLVTSWSNVPSIDRRFSGLVDHMVFGPGEDALLRIAGGGLPSSDDAQPVFTGLPLEQYLSPGVVLPYCGSSGCYWGRCTFCPESSRDSHYRMLAPDLIMLHLSNLENELKPALLHMTDNALSPAFMERLARERSQEGRAVTPWYAFARVTHHLADPDFCKGLARSGCVMLKLGIESGDQAVLDAMQKGHDVETSGRALCALKSAGISTYVYLIFGTPEEDESSARATLEFVAREHSNIDFLNLALFNLPIYGAQSATVCTIPFSGGDLSLYTDFAHPRGWNRGRARQFIEKDLGRHPAVRQILRNKPPFFTSNHAPFFAMRKKPVHLT